MRLEYFQMIDRIVEIDIGERVIKSVCAVPKESPVFEGHFPTYPLLPGVLQIECMAQTVGWLASALLGFKAMPILAAVKGAKFRASVFPGDSLKFEGKVLHEGSGYTVGECKGWRDTTAICDAQMTYRVIPFANPQFRQAVCEWAERIGVAVTEFAK